MKILLTGVLSALALSFASAPAQTVIVQADGQVALGGKPLRADSRFDRRVEPGEVVATGQGSAVIALLYGAQVRLDAASAIRLAAQDARRTEVAIVGGGVEINVNGMHEGDELQVDTAGGVQTLLLQNGLYEFDAKAGELRVFDGKAAVASSASSGWLTVPIGRTLKLDSSTAQPVAFDRDKGDGFARREDRGEFGSMHDDGDFGGYEQAPYGLGFAYPGYGFAPYPYPFAGFYSPFAFGYFPGYYGGFGYGRGFGYGGIRGGRFRR